MKKIMVFVICIIALTDCKKEDFQENLTQATPSLNSNHIHRRCQSDERMSALYQQKTGYRNEINQGRLKLQGESQNAEIRSNAETYTIPVHVIIVHRSGQGIGQGANLSNQRVYDQVARLNMDFRKRNSDVSKTPSIFPTSDSQIEFCLANRDPQGRSSSGITRYAYNGNFDSNESRIKSTTGWDPKRYLNIWVVEDIEGLGYAYLPTPSSLPDADVDGVVILTSTFGDGPQLENSYNKGRTATHEVGHYLGLDHIWGNGCRTDDGIQDTPEQRDYNEGCPSHPSPSCNNSGDMFMNYMDYADDRCMFAFTPGQTNYMRYILSTSRSVLVEHGAKICQSSDPDPDKPTCSDGIKNGNETGIDCGGSCRPCETSGTKIDLAIESFSTAQSGCNNKVSTVFRIKNHGSVSVDNYDVKIYVNGGLVFSKQYSQMLLPSAVKSFEAGPLPLQNISNTLKVTVSARGDANVSNNTVSKNITPQQHNARVVIKPDDYGGDIWWELWNDDTDELIDEGYNYPDFDRTQITKNFCLEEGCYSFIMYDLYGDGLCCDYGRGWYKILDGNSDIIAQSNGRYEDYDIQSFCIGQRAARQAVNEPKSFKIKSFEKRQISKY